MEYAELPSYLNTLSMALRLDPSIYATIQSSPDGFWIAFSVVVLAGISEATGQSLVLFVNHIRPARFGLALALATLSHIAGYVIWTLTIWSVGRLLFDTDQPLIAVASAVGLAYAPQLFSFFVLTPFLGNLFGIVLSLWSMLAVIIAVRAGLLLETWQAVLLAVLGWILLQTMRRTIGRPVLRLQRWASNRAAGVDLTVRPNDLAQVRRHPIRTWYTQLESWRTHGRPVATSDPAPHPKSSHHV